MVDNLAPEIVTLSNETIKKIAAGQVIEDPVCAVKELLENAIDAGAKKIIIDIKDGGKKRIMIADDGIGIEKKDLTKVILPHTTSKIKKFDDLTRIKSYGFRGEALASLTEVANVFIQSRKNYEDFGYELEIEKNILKPIKKIGMGFGTVVTVENLFSQIPARIKFLKSKSYEFNKILSLVTKYCLSHYDLSFKLIHDKKIIFDLVASDLKTRIFDVLGVHFANQILPIQIDEPHYKIWGYIGKPQLAVHANNRSFIFVNKRPVNSDLIAKVIKKVFGTLIEPRAYPAFILFFELSSELIDINIDPKKTKISFIYEDAIKKILHTAVAELLSSVNLTYSFENEKNQNQYYPEFSMQKKLANNLKEAHIKGAEVWNLNDPLALENNEILQIHNLYLTAQTKNGVCMIDQHAAHERILYEEYLKIFQQEKSKKQTIKLKKSLQLNLSIDEIDFLLSELGNFEKLGFGIIANSQNYVEIFQIPKIFDGFDINKLVTEIIYDIRTQGEIDVDNDLDITTHRTIAYLACRSAIKAGDRLSQKQMKDLIKKLKETTSNYTCPHGRPVTVFLSLKELHQLFKRI